MSARGGQLEQFHIGVAAVLGPLAFVLGLNGLSGKLESRTKDQRPWTLRTKYGLRTKNQEQRTSRTTSSTTTRTRRTKNTLAAGSGIQRVQPSLVSRIHRREIRAIADGVFGRKRCRHSLRHATGCRPLGSALQRDDEIRAFQAADRAERPWIHFARKTAGNKA